MTNEFDMIFERAGIDYHVKPLLLKAIALRESNLDPKAYRYEPDYWENYLKYLDAWKDQVPTVVSASYGLMQLMFTTARGLGFGGVAEELYDPAININLLPKETSSLTRLFSFIKKSVLIPPLGTIKLPPTEITIGDSIDTL